MEKDWTVANFESITLNYPDIIYKTDIKVPRSEHRDEFIKGLLTLDRTKRLGSSNNFHGFEQDIKSHPWVGKIDWDLIAEKRILPEYRPNVYLLLLH